MNTACRITYPTKETFEYKSIEEASKGTEEYANNHPKLAKKYKPVLSVAAIKLRCNKSEPPKDGVVCEWLDEHTKLSYRAKKSRSKGRDLEYKIRDKLREIGYTGVERAAGESKKVDNNKIDLLDTEHKLPVNIQAKNYANTPNYFGIKEECTDKSKPFLLCWKKNTLQSNNVVFFVPEDFFYELLDAYTKQNNILK